MHSDDDDNDNVGNVDVNNGNGDVDDVVNGNGDVDVNEVLVLAYDVDGVLLTAL